MKALFFIIILSFASSPALAIEDSENQEARIIQLITPYSYSQNETPYYAVIYEMPSPCYTADEPQSELIAEDNLIKVTVPIRQTSDICTQQIRIESKTIQMAALPLGYYRLIANKGRSAVFLEISPPSASSYAHVENFTTHLSSDGTSEVEIQASLMNSCEYLATPESNLSQRILTISANTETVYDSTCEVRETKTTKTLELPYESKEFKNIAIKRADEKPLFAYRDYFTDEWVVIQ